MGQVQNAAVHGDVLVKRTDSRQNQLARAGFVYVRGIARVRLAAVTDHGGNRQFRIFSDVDQTGKIACLERRIVKSAEPNAVCRDLVIRSAGHVDGIIQDIIIYAGFIGAWSRAVSVRGNDAVFHINHVIDRGMRPGFIVVERSAVLQSQTSDRPARIPQKIIMASQD